MKASQHNMFDDNHVQTEVENLYNVLNKISFGETVDQRGENIDCFIVEVSGVSGVDTSASHSLGRQPSGRVVINQDASGTIYDNSSGASANTDTAFWYRNTTTGTKYKIAII